MNPAYGMPQVERTVELGWLKGSHNAMDLEKLTKAIEEDSGVVVYVRYRPIVQGPRVPGVEPTRAVHLECSSYYMHHERHFILDLFRDTRAQAKAIKGTSGILQSLVPPYRTLECIRV